MPVVINFLYNIYASINIERRETLKHKLSDIDKQVIVISFFRNELILEKTFQMKLLNLTMLLLLDPSESIDLLPIL